MQYYTVFHNASYLKPNVILVMLSDLGLVFTKNSWECFIVRMKYYVCSVQCGVLSVGYAVGVSTIKSQIILGDIPFLCVTPIIQKNISVKEKHSYLWHALNLCWFIFRVNNTKVEFGHFYSWINSLEQWLGIVLSLIFFRNEFSTTGSAQTRKYSFSVMVFENQLRLNG